MSVITTGSIGKAAALEASALTFWGTKYPKAEPLWTKIFEKTPPPKASYAEDVGISGLGVMRLKNEGSGITFDTMKQSYVKRYVPTVYALGYIVTEEMMDDGTAISNILSGNDALQFSAFQTMATLAFDIFNNAVSSSYPGGDGKELLATDHPKYKVGGTFANEPSVLADVSEAVLEAAQIAVTNMQNDAGNTLGLTCRRLIGSSSLEHEFTRLLHSSQRVGTANNDISSIVFNNSFPEGYICSPFITDLDMWVVQTNCPNGFKYYAWKELTFGRDKDFGTGNLLFKAQFRKVWGWTDPRCAYGSPGA